MTNTQAFDQAFAPYDTGHLAQLIGSVTDLDKAGRWCHMVDNGEALAVFDHYCAFCNAIHGGADDGKGPCIHKHALSLAWRAELMARDEDAEDLRVTRALP
jgi:hypothetical protein